MPEVHPRRGALDRYFALEVWRAVTVMFASHPQCHGCDELRELYFVSIAIFLDLVTHSAADLRNTVIPFQKHLPLFEMRKNYKTSETHVHRNKGWYI